MTAPYSAGSTAVRAFVEAYEENRNLAVARTHGGAWHGRYHVFAEDRRKYVIVDEVTYAHCGDLLDKSRSGRFMVDRQTGTVYTIHGYGKRGDRVGQIETLTASFEAASATYNPDAGYHWENSRTRLATT